MRDDNQGAGAEARYRGSGFHTTLEYFSVRVDKEQSGCVAPFPQALLLTTSKQPSWLYREEAEAPLPIISKLADLTNVCIESVEPLS